MENREGIYTQFANAINKFTNHLLTKKQLFEIFVSMVEISIEDERNDRIKYKKFWEDNNGKIIPEKDIPYSNYAHASEMMEK